ncbi:MAG TPA: hypothetical protein VFB45_14270 [Pseudolabrys sp.]|nr:hypothetical protein [Pseudolabrys sp.]
MAISGIGVQVITARSGIGTQLPPPEPRNDNDRDSHGPNGQEVTSPPASPGTGQVIDLKI